MKLRKVSGCKDGECPAVYLSDQGTVVFQGTLVAEVDGLQLGVGERAVELPLDVVRSTIPAIAEG